MSEIRSVGIPSPRVEGEQKVGGDAIYAIDVVLPDMLWAKVLRSPIAHGRIKKIDAAKALALPGVRAVVDRRGSRRRQDRQKDRRHAAPRRRRGTLRR